MLDWSQDVRIRLSQLRLSATREAEILEELSQHLDERYAELRTSGVSDEDARRLAIEELCETDRLADEMRELRQAHVAAHVVPGAAMESPPLANIWRDVRYGFRGLIRERAFTFVAVVTLALGIGATAAIFSAIHSVLLDPAPYADVDRLAFPVVYDLGSDANGERNAFHINEIREFQQSKSFEAITAGRRDDVLLSTAEGTEQYRGAVVTPNTFRLLGVPPLLGRALTDADAAPGAPPVFVMSHNMWSSRFNSDPGVVGRTFVLDDVAITCVGVMPKRFTKNGGDLWRPLALDRTDPDSFRAYFFFQGKLKPGVTLEQATAEMNALTRRVAKSYPHLYPKQFDVRVVSWLDGQIREFRTTLYTLFAAVALLLLISCSNVANMLLARGASRAKELAIRTSLGASQWLIVRQLVLESLLLGLGGALVGCVFGYLGIKGIAGLIPLGLPGEIEVRMSMPVLWFSLATGVLTALCFGLAPALQTVNRNIDLKDIGRGVIGSFRRRRLTNVLVIAEVALSLVLLSSAGLLMRSFAKLHTIDLGLTTENVLFVNLLLPSSRYQSAQSKESFFAGALQRIESLPGVVGAGVTMAPPPYGGGVVDVDIPGKSHTQRWTAVAQLVSDGYFHTIGLRPLSGRTFVAADVEIARKVAVVNESFAKRYFAGENPLGRLIYLKQLEKLPDGHAVPHPMFEVVGVIANVRNRGIIEPAAPEIVLPYTISGAFNGGILVRTRDNPEPLVNSIRHEIWAVDRGVAITDASTLNTLLTRSTYARPRFTLVLLAVFASLGLVLVAIGVYSVIAYAVSKQRHEIGIRMALGAGRAELIRMVSAMGMRLVGLGAAIGLIASFGATKVIASQLTDVSPNDPLTLAGVVGLMALAGIAACYFPARRAASVDPLVALRLD